MQYNWGEFAKESAEKVLSNVEFKTYPRMGHATCQLEMRDVRTFVNKVLPIPAAIGGNDVV